MNESKLRKGTKYVSLKDEDVHTVTGAVKQFFRELKTELISENIVKNLPNDLGKQYESIIKFESILTKIAYIYRKRIEFSVHSKWDQYD